MEKSSSEITFEKKKVPRIFNLKQAIEQGRNKHKNNLSMTGREELMNSQTYYTNRVNRIKSFDETPGNPVGSSLSPLIKQSTSAAENNNIYVSTQPNSNLMGLSGNLLHPLKQSPS
mgnify:CR=1 FL=1